MKTNKELREQAWEITWSKLGLRFVSAYITFITISLVIGYLIDRYYGMHGIQTWQDFHLSKAQMGVEGLILEPSSSTQSFRMTLASAFSGFFDYLLSGISAIGLAALGLKLFRKSGQGVNASTFEGFKRPLEVFWLSFSYAVRIALWTLLFIFPGLIAIFRYSQVWLIKAENPELSANQCIVKSSEMMNGHKLRLLRLLFSYFGWILGIVCLFSLTLALQPVNMWLHLLVLALTVLYTLFAVAYIYFGCVAFYDDLTSNLSHHA